VVKLAEIVRVQLEQISQDRLLRGCGWDKFDVDKFDIRHDSPLS